MDACESILNEIKNLLIEIKAQLQLINTTLGS